MTCISRRQLIKASALVSVIPTLPLMSFASDATTTAEVADPWPAYQCKSNVAKFALHLNWQY